MIIELSMEAPWEIFDSNTKKIEVLQTRQLLKGIRQRFEVRAAEIKFFQVFEITNFVRQVFAQKRNTRKIEIFETFQPSDGGRKKPNYSRTKLQ